MLLCDETLTLVRRAGGPDGDVYAAHAVKRASWRGGVQIRSGAGGAVRTDGIRSRIPAWSLAPGVVPAPGDILVRGALPEGFALTGPDDLAAFERGTVTQVRDNLGGLIPHWAVICA